MKTIGYVEDNDSIRENYEECLVDAGFKVHSFAEASDALNSFQEDMPDLLLLDIGLGHQRDAGLQLCFDVRKFNSSVPIIFLTSHDKDYEKISGLRMGADDYITKDSNIDYILVRIETLLRRVEALQKDANLVREEVVKEKSSVELNDKTCQAYYNGKNLDLSLTQYWILHELYLGAGKLKSHAELMKAASIVVEPNTIVAHVKAIRSRFKSINEDFDAIRTARGVGYQWLDSES